MAINFRDIKSVKVTRIKFTESRRPFSRTHRSLEDYRICYTAIEESNWDILPSEFCQKRNWFQLFQKKKREDQLNSQWKSLFQFNISGRTKRSTSLPEEMFCRMPCQRVPVWITEKRLLQILGHPAGRYFIKENIFFGGKSSSILPSLGMFPGRLYQLGSILPVGSRRFLSRVPGTLIPETIERVKARLTLIFKRRKWLTSANVPEIVVQVTNRQAHFRVFRVDQESGTPFKLAIVKENVPDTSTVTTL